MRTVLPLTAAAMAAAMALATTAFADANRNEVSLGGTGRALRSSSANAVTGDNLSGASIGLARDLGIAPLPGLLPGLALWAEAGLATGTADGMMFESMATEINELGLTGGLAARYRLHRLVTASARVALGAQRASLRITDSPSSQSGSGWGALAQAGAAVDLLATARSSFGIGVRVELGYVAAQGVGLALHRSGPSVPNPLVTSDLMIGRLDLSGPSAGVSLLGQF